MAEVGSIYFSLYGLEKILLIFFFSETFEANMAIFWGLLSSLQT